MSARYRIDAEHSEFTVHAFAGGLLSFMAHSPIFAVRAFAGEVTWEPGSSDRQLTLAVEASSLDLINGKPGDKSEIEERMRREVLEVERFPTIGFAADDFAERLVEPYRYDVKIWGTLSLHGVVRHHGLQAEVRQFSDGMRLAGATALRLSEFGIQPVTALAGTIRLKDELRLAFDIAAWKET